MLLKTVLDLGQALCCSPVSSEQPNKSTPLYLFFEHIWGATYPTFNDSELAALCSIRLSFKRQMCRVIFGKTVSEITLSHGEGISMTVVPEQVFIGSLVDNLPTEQIS